MSLKTIIRQLNVYHQETFLDLPLSFIILTLLCLSYPSFTQGEYNYDSLFQTVENLENDSLKSDGIRKAAMNFRLTNPELGINIYERLKQAPFYFISERNPRYDDYMMGELHLHANNFKQCEFYLTSYYNFWKGKAGHENDLSAAKLKLSDLYILKGEREKAIEASTQAEELSDKAGLIDLKVRAAANTAGIMNKAGRTEDALRKLWGLIPEAQESNSALSQVYNKLSVIYDDHGPIDSALHYMHKYKDLTFDTPNFANQFIALYNIARAESNNEKHELALETINEAAELADKSGVPIFKPYVLLEKAGILTNLGNYSLARQLFEEASQYDLLPDQYAMLIQGRYLLHKKQGKYQSALSYLEEWKTIQDSIRSEEIAKNANEIEIRYEAVKKENQIDKLENQQLLQNQKIKMQSLGILGLSLALLVLAALFYVIFRQRNKIKNQNTIISKALKEKETLLKEIHHRVKNNLQIISSLLSLQSRAVKDEQASSALEEGQNRVQSMALIHQYLYSGDNITGVRVKDYLQDLCRNVFTSHQIDPDKVDLKLDIQDMDLDISTVVPLGLVLNELITNSCKYAFPNGTQGKISVSLHEREGKMIVEVEDDGVGFDKERAEGFGSKLIQSFARKMGAEVQISNEGGASVLLKIKKYQKIS